MTIARTNDSMAAKYARASEALAGRLAGDLDDEVVTACEEYVAAEDALPDHFDGEDYTLSGAVETLVTWWKRTAELRSAALDPSVEVLLAELDLAKAGQARAESDAATILDLARGAGLFGPRSEARFGMHTDLVFQAGLAEPEQAAWLHGVLVERGPRTDADVREALDQQWRALHVGLGGPPGEEARLTVDQALVLLRGFGFSPDGRDVDRVVDHNARVEVLNQAVRAAQHEAERLRREVARLVGERDAALAGRGAP